jgi:L-lactate utilization protein LutC
MGLDELRARLDRLLAGGPDRRAQASGLHDALVELKVAAGQNKDALATAERELAAERIRLDDAERRGRLAGEIGDTETGQIAEEFAAKHRERVALLERKVAVIRDELAYVEREYQTLAAQLKSVRQGGGSVGPTPLLDESERELDALRHQAEREAKDLAVQQQLELLKKKLGKQ